MSVTEAELKAIAVAPRVTQQDVFEAIKGEEFLYTQTMTICVLTLQNGNTVLGESACASPANYNKDVGDRLAREKAINKIWPLLGYELRTKLHMIEKAGKPSGKICSLGSPVTYLGTKVVHALEMDRLTYNQLRGWTIPKDEDPEDLGYLVQYADGGDPNVEGFTGYISWSPRDVFERAYDVGIRQGEENFFDRLIDEMLDLSKKVHGLTAFMGTQGFQKVSVEEQQDLAEQLEAMEEYLDVLNKRIARHSY